jgi:hypothetical protein
MAERDPISGLSAVSTGSVWIRPEHVGPTRKNVYVWLVTSHQWTRPLPINAYVIEHREGLVLFDTGQDRAGVTDPEYFPPGFTGFLYDRLNDAELLAAGIVPGAGNKRQLRRTVAAVNELRLRTPGLIVLPAHDPQAARRLSASLTTPTWPAEPMPPG